MAIMKNLVGPDAKSRNRNTFKQIHNTIGAEEGIRASRRLKMKKKQKIGLCKHVKTLHRTVEYAQSPIEYGNPAQKVLFLTSLGLTPKEGILMPPFVALEHLKISSPRPVAVDVSTRKTIPKTQPRVTPANVFSNKTMSLEEVESCHYSDSDIEDLDLELLIYPLDIPEFLEDIYCKRRKCNAIQVQAPLHNTALVRKTSDSNNVELLPEQKNSVLTNNLIKSSLPQQTQLEPEFLSDHIFNNPGYLVIDITDSEELDYM